MRNWLAVFVVSSLLAAIGFSQEAHPAPAAAAETSAEGHEGGKEKADPLLLWKWINFGILAAGIGYMLAKNLPGFFQSRTGEIQKGISEAAKMKADADAKAAGMEERLARIGAEVESLRAKAKQEMSAEGDRIRKETETLVAKMQAAAESEIESMTKAARQELKSYSAQLAIDMAEQIIRARVSGGSEQTLVDNFIRGLEGKGTNN